jgi:aminoglycoside phosphotransferase (APT) family kinase protein
MLGQLHAALDDCPLDLPLLPGAIGDVTAALELTDHRVLHAAAERLLPLAERWPRRVVHGDAHVGNVVVTADGPRWTDLEDAGLGPVEWDLSPSSVTDAVLAAYPGPVDPARLVDCRALRSAQSLAADLTDDIDASAMETYVAQLVAWLG